MADNHGTLWWEFQLHNSEHTTTCCYPVWFRTDLPRSHAQAYWRGKHGQIANKNSVMQEYLQYHFSDTDHGLWNTPEGISKNIPVDWKMDGLSEVRFHGLMENTPFKLIASTLSALLSTKGITYDEQNVFDRVLAKMTKRNGGANWKGPYQPEIGFRALVFLRARLQSKGKPFTHFMENTLAPALLNAGADELRTHIFQKGSRFAHWTPEVRHDEPVNRNYNATMVIGTQTRKEFDALMTSPELHATQTEQSKHCLAIHAYAIENTYPLVLNAVPQDATWD